MGALLLLLLLVASPGQGQAATPACTANFTIQGGRLSGYELTTHARYPHLAPAAAFRSLEIAIAHAGGMIQSANPRLGTFSAPGALGPNIDTGHTVNALVTPSGSGARVQLSLQVAPFRWFHKDAIERRFCTWLTAVGSAQRRRG